MWCFCFLVKIPMYWDKIDIVDYNSIRDSLNCVNQDGDLLVFHYKMILSGTYILLLRELYCWLAYFVPRHLLYDTSHCGMCDCFERLGKIPYCPRRKKTRFCQMGITVFEPWMTCIAKVGVSLWSLWRLVTCTSSKNKRMFGCNGGGWSKSSLLEKN